MQYALSLLAVGMLVSTSFAQEGPDAWAQDAQGWTILPQDVGTPTQWYVSVGGNDTTGNGSAAAPFRHIYRALPPLGTMAPGDCLNIKRGDVFPESFTQCAGGNWTLPGASLLAPTVVATYGTSTNRPIFQCWDHVTLAGENGLQIHASVQDVRFVGLHLLVTTPNDTMDRPYGISVLSIGGSGASQRVLFEDFKVEGFFEGVRFQGDGLTGQRHQDIRLRRSLVIDSYTTTTDHSGGLYAQDVDGLLIEECLFDHNGWSEDPSHPTWADIYRHNVYIQDNVTGVTVHGNIIARGGSHGLQARSGGTITYNLMLRNPINALIGYNFTGFNTNGVTATVVGNVMIDSADLMEGPLQSQWQRRGWSMEFRHLAYGDIHHNICAWNETPITDLNSDRRSYQFTAPLTGNAGINRADFHDNISYDWRAPIWLFHENFGSQGYPPTPGLQLGRFITGGLGGNHIQEPRSQAQVIKWIRSSPSVLQFPSPQGLQSSNNRVHSNLTEVSGTTGWCSWPYSTPMLFANWQSTVNDNGSTAGPPVPAYPMVFDGLSPELPHPTTPDCPTPLWSADNIVPFLLQCRQLLSKQTWVPANREFLATNLVHRYGTFFGLTIP